jgi:hypothetical protein
MACICFLYADLISFAVFRQRRGPLPLQGNQKVSPRTRRRSIKSARTEIRIRIRIKSIRSTGTVIKTEVKIKIRRRRRIEVRIMILVLITQRNTMKRLAKSLL